MTAASSPEPSDPLLTIPEYDPDCSCSICRHLREAR